MYIQQLYTGCLSEAAYFIESGGEVAVVDPMRDVQVYLDMAKEREARIKYIFETHFHADFVSGHVELARSTGATIIYGPGTETAFSVHVAHDGERFQLGELQFEVLHTPGHTLESSCYLLRDKAGKEVCLFTGDTLFVGDVGRPDLAQNPELDSGALAGMLFDSIQQKIMPLPDDLMIYPAHGAGSACGKNLGPETFSTLGEQKQQNYALQAQSREEFIKAVIEGLPQPPQYFSINAKINKEGYGSLEEVMDKALQPLSVAGLVTMLRANPDLILLDTRPAAEFTQGFIPDSIFIGLEGRFAEWAGSLLSFDLDIVLITEPGKEKESAIRLARVGFERIQGYLEGGFNAWQAERNDIDMIVNVDAAELAMDLPFDENLVVLDVRKQVEFADGHVEHAHNIPLDDFKDPGALAVLEDRNNIYVQCAAGYRSVIASSILKKQGIHNIRNVEGGWAALKDQPGISVVKETSVLN